MKKLSVLLGALLLGLFAMYYFSAAVASKDQSAPAYAETRVARVDLVDSTVATGTVKSKVGAEVKVGSQISGVVVKLTVGVGDRVRKGDLLALLDDASLRARANLLKAELKSAIAEESYAQLELEKFERAATIMPAIQVENSRRNLAVKRATVEQVRARQADADVQLGHARIVAPISGTVASISTYVGETVAASFAAPTFLTIVDLNQMEIQAYVDESDIGKVQVGQQVQLRVDSFRDRQLPGRVRAIYPKAQLLNNVVNYVLVIDIENAAALPIRPDMTARVDLILASRPAALAIPRSALLSEQGNNYVVAKVNANWTRKPVKVGMKTSQLVEVLGGLGEGETIAGDVQQWRETQKGSKL